MGRLTRRAVLLDRDGTLNVCAALHEYVTTAEAFEWLPGAPEALARLSRAGYVLGVASNQRGVARGLIPAATLTAIEQRIQHDLAPLGSTIEAFRYCPHDYDARCDCRKPKPGLLQMLAGDLDIDLDQSWMVGDSASDVAAGRAAGCRTALVGAPVGPPEPDVSVASLTEFAELLTVAERPLSEAERA